MTDTPETTAVSLDPSVVYFVSLYPGFENIRDLTFDPTNPEGPVTAHYVDGTSAEIDFSEVLPA